MQIELWGETVPRQRRKSKPVPLTTAKPYSITGTNKDCEVIGHTLREWDLAGCTICLDCGANIFCPCCTLNHPKDENAVPVLCERHQESMVSA